MLKVLLKHLARLYLPVYQYQSEKMNILYAGYSSIKKNYYARLFLGCDHHHSFSGMRFFWEIPGLVKRGNHDIVVAETSRISLKNFRKSDGYILPEWAMMKININRPMSDICKHSASDFSDVARLTRKYGLTYEILTQKESFTYFIDRFYKPYITKRHGKEALIEDLNKSVKSIPDPMLLAIKEKGSMVAGSLVKQSGDVFYLINLGLLDGNEGYLRHGVIGAIYYFGIIEGKKRECRYMDIGGTHPFLSDRLTEYKIGLGAEFISDHSSWKEYLWLGINERSSAAKEFIGNNKFMCLNKENMLVSSAT